MTSWLYQIRLLPTAVAYLQMRCTEVLENTPETPEYIGVPVWQNVESLLRGTLLEALSLESMKRVSFDLLGRKFRIRCMAL